MARSDRSWRTWVGRIAFGFSVLALLGTSLPRWQIDAKLEGPDRAPTDDQAVKVSIESSHPPVYRRSTKTGERVDGTQCTLGWTRETQKVECLLPPGSKLDSVDTADKCHDSGCCSNKPCKPPEGAFVRAKTTIVPIWKHIVEKEAQVRLEKNKQEGNKFVLHKLDVGLENAPRDVEVTVRGKGPSDRGAAWDGKEVNVDCRGFSADGGTPFECIQYNLVQDVEKPIDVTVIVKATIFGACEGEGGACTPPPEAAALRITSVAMKAD
jgi:hypothetical protein